MHIILGYELDTGSYPDALGNDEARQGVVVLGPAGLVGVLETRLGLTRIQTHQAIRIGQYLKRLKEADNNERFYSKSIRVDAWSTAKQVLAWRDELVLAGWKGDVPGQISNRLQAYPQEHSKVLMIRGKGSPVLDDTLNAHNLPKLGYQSRSPWRTALQVLPLILSNYWALRLIRL